MSLKKLRLSLFDIVSYIVLTAAAIISIYPFYYLLIYSISLPAEAYSKGVYLIPRGFTLDNYIRIMGQKDILHAVLISLSRTVLGTLITVLCTTMFAYVLTKRQYRTFKYFYRIAVVTLYLNPGIIPWYLTMKTLRLDNNFLLYILPSAVVAFYLILVKTYMESMPVSLEESAMIDGAGYFTIYKSIILPICKPIVATIAVFSAVGQWNQWYDNFMLVQDKNLITLQLMLMNYLRESERLAKATSDELQKLTRTVTLTPQSIRITITMVVTLPILIVYPFLQRYFVKGIMIGAIKG